MTSISSFLAAVAAPAASGAGASRWPFVVLLASVAFIIFAITRLRLHAFIALIFAAFLAGFLSEPFAPGVLDKLPKATRAAAEGNQWLATVELTMIEFGNTAAAISISIGLAAIIGMALMESGGADKVVRRFLGFFGEQRAGAALLWSTYVLSIPIFFDTMFMLMVPLARALRLRTGKDYTLYLLCICCGGVVTHSLTVPHPGPLAMVDSLKVDVGLSLVWGILAGIVPCLGGYYAAKWINARVDIPLRETRGAALTDLEGISRKPESELPSFFWSILPVILPIALISLASTFVVIRGSFPGAVAALGGAENFAALHRWVAFFGNKNIALFLGAGIALAVLARRRAMSFRQIEELIGPPIETAGVIILITSAGGAFGLMLRNAGGGRRHQDGGGGFRRESSRAGLAGGGGDPDRAGVGHGGDADDVGDGVSDDGSGGGRGAAVSSDVRLSGDRVRGVHLFLDERFRFLGGEPAERDDRDRDAPHLDGAVDRGGRGWVGPDLRGREDSPAGVRLGYSADRPRARRNHPETAQTPRSGPEFVNGPRARACGRR
jgi:GntP family gluconate:H+ symporter